MPIQRLLPAALLSTLCLHQAAAADGIQTKTTYAKAYGETRNAVTVDPAKDLPRYPAVEPAEAIGTWQVKKGFELALAAHEPRVRDPIAVCFDERGRMFVCEMIDYSEMRDVTPHLGRISMLEDKDGDGDYETSQVFADDLPWPTGLIWANGGLFVGATPDIWRLEDKDGDGRAEVREKAFTGFGTGLKILNVQGLMNSFQWGQDNRVHVLAGGGNRGQITCPKRPELPAQELGGRDFWFDPVTLEFGLEGGGAQYGMSFDDYGRKFGCSNSDHLQSWVYDDAFARRNPLSPMPAARRSIAVDGGAAEVFRLSPDEPWRIIRTRWRIAGVVKGSVEGGGRVSGYFTGATGTTVYRGDAYGVDFKNNTFSGDAGGQLVHRKIIRYSQDGIQLEGERPADERGFEFAASKDTWVRVVNFANAPDGCLYICDMYREVIEHPWSVPDEIKKHLDLNSGNDRGRLYRIQPAGYTTRSPRAAPWAAGPRTRPGLQEADTATLVRTLAHPNGWHRDTSSRLLFERKDKASISMLLALLKDTSTPAVGKLHAMQALQAVNALDDAVLLSAMQDPSPEVQERALALAAVLHPSGDYPPALLEGMMVSPGGQTPRVAFQRALTLASASGPKVDDALLSLAPGADKPSPWLEAAIASGAPARAFPLVMKMEAQQRQNGWSQGLLLALIETVGARKDPAECGALLDLWTRDGAQPLVAKLAALGSGLRRSGSSLAAVDQAGKLNAAFARAQAQAKARDLDPEPRLRALALLGLATPAQARDSLLACLDGAENEAVQNSAVSALLSVEPKAAVPALVEKWPGLKGKAAQTALAGLLARDEGARAVLAAMALPEAKMAPAVLSASQVQALATHKNKVISTEARKVLASVIPPSREEMVKKFQPAVAAQGDATRGQVQFMARCFACHRANGQGMAVGPDMVTVKTRGRDGLLTAILEPHKEVASQYIAYLVNTKDGQTLNGIIARDDAASMTLRMMGGAETTVQRSQIQGSSSSGQSLMPEGLEQGMSVQDMADLLSFIEAVKG